MDFTWEYRYLKKGEEHGSENQSVSGVITICFMQSDTSPLHRVDQAVECGLWNVVPLLFNGCAKLLDIDGNWNTLSYTSIQSIPNILNGWCVVSMQAAEELGHFQLAGVVYRSLRHGAVYYHAET
jgi:hypothetical protein